MSKWFDYAHAISLFVIAYFDFVCMHTFTNEWLSALYCWLGALVCFCGMYKLIMLGEKE